jgi:hypothetical protein
MTMISLSDKIAGLRHFLVHAAIFGAVVTVGFSGLLTIDRQLASSTCAECSALSPQLVDQTAFAYGDDMAAILRE